MLDSETTNKNERGEQHIKVDKSSRINVLRNLKTYVHLQLTYSYDTAY